MAILRKNNRESFTVVCNEAIRDEELSLKALGLLVHLLSLPDNWEFSEDGLIKIFKKDGQASIRSGLKELESRGYLKRERNRDEKGRLISVEWTVYEKPRLENPSLDMSSLENPNLENRPQYNTKETKDEYNKELSNKNPHTPTGAERKSESKKHEFPQWFYDGISDYSAEEQEGLMAWAEYRKAIKKPLTQRALKMQLKKVKDMAEKSNLSIKEYLEEVVCRSWQGFYEIPSGYKKPCTDDIHKPTNQIKYEEMF